MKKKKIIISTIIIMALIILAIGIFFTIKNINNKKQQQESNESQKTFEEFKNSSIMYDEEANLNELKQEYKITGPDELYEIQTEYDGRKAVVVKAEINYKTAFAGLIKKEIPSFSELDSCMEENYPKGTGIWVEKSSQEKIVNYLNNTKLLNNEYSIDDNGFLQVNKKENQTKTDETIEKLINSEELNLITISGTSYMVDAVTGEIVRNPFEDLDNYQSCEYFENDNSRIIFITENINGKLTDNEILESIIEIIKT